MSVKNQIKTTLSLLLNLLSLSLVSIAAPPPKHVAITQFVEHVAADEVRKGVEEELARKGFKNGENLNITFENAQGNATTAGQIARKFLGLKPDVIVAITTPAAQAIVKVVGKDTFPIVFSAVTDPVQAGLVSSLNDHKSMVTGVMDAPPIKRQIAFIKTILPDAKKLGILYNPGDISSTASLKIIKEEAAAQGLTLVEATALRSSDIQAAVLQLEGKVDAIYVPLDNMIVSAMKTVASLALKHKIPLFAADSGSVESGALACLGYSYLQAGRTTGELVVNILNGQNPAEIPVASPEKVDIFVNQLTLEKLGLSLPKEVLQHAHYY